jgi:chromosome segregation ATPase
VSTKSEKASQTAKREQGGADPSGGGGSAARRQPAADGRTEAQLRERVVGLEARVAEVTRCLEAAENRAAELAATQQRMRSMQERVQSIEAERDLLRARIDELERKLRVITTSRSWQMTKHARSAMSRVRRTLGN